MIRTAIINDSVRFESHFGQPIIQIELIVFVLYRIFNGNWLELTIESGNGNNSTLIVFAIQIAVVNDWLRLFLLIFGIQIAINHNRLATTSHKKLWH